MITFTVSKSKISISLIPDFGEDGGDKKVVEDPARSAEYKTERTVVTIPRIRVLVETALDLFRPLHA